MVIKTDDFDDDIDDSQVSMMIMLMIPFWMQRDQDENEGVEIINLQDCD